MQRESAGVSELCSIAVGQHYIVSVSDAVAIVLSLAERVAVPDSIKQRLPDSVCVVKCNSLRDCVAKRSVVGLIIIAFAVLYGAITNLATLFCPCEPAWGGSGCLPGTCITDVNATDASGNTC